MVTEFIFCGFRILLSFDFEYHYPCNDCSLSMEGRIHFFRGGIPGVGLSPRSKPGGGANCGRCEIGLTLILLLIYPDVLEVECLSGECHDRTMDSDNS